MDRLDIYLFENGYFDSREQAKRNIMAGNVMINERIADKAGTMVKESDRVSVKEKDCPFVSRGGLKLLKAIKSFNIDITGMTALDIGSSTGGFTDCMLQNGVIKIYAVDVGYGQLDWRLRNDPRVVSMERKNFRNMEFEEINEKVDFVTMDVSFISITKLVDKVREFLKDGGTGVILIKPQFEAGKENVGKNGVVKDMKIHKQVIEKVINYFENNGFAVVNLDYSPVKGAKGNIEYILQIYKGDVQGKNILENIDLVVQSAHNNL